MKGRGDRKALCGRQDSLKTLSVQTQTSRCGVTMSRDPDNNIPRHPAIQGVPEKCPDVETAITASKAFKCPSANKLPEDFKTHPTVGRR